MILGLHLIKMEQRSMVKCALSIDNQATLIAIKSKMNKSGRHLVASLHQATSKLHEQRGNNRFRLTFRWSAGHIGIEGNEDADKLAKAAAGGDSSAKKDLPPCLCKAIGHSLTAT